ncbi:MAG: creatininase family protein [Bacillota bacterium]|uniref:Creatininase family protein n=1 Tax=Virgibacillus salarius TaxID=447199 RepID=A0A941DV95_9BACI|nr:MULTISPECIES: creatininase family protein [Bacillaceae]NAZ08772.1 creatininase family protein [Agaribacter marinus]MBR7796061.1 creatininase family protein [Virgibacillus salarius]MCC2252283.1 creatininase family protein [Virgibacillus sp. AGTR]MDY7045241.1 creatininase family protein [Virgibacillus sp. M23]QRZ18237.1 creatininase family protein [Virgibacillus sp. AGTR]
MEFQYQNSYEIEEKIKTCKVALLPIGAVEAHGPHLPLGTDNILAESVARRLAEQVNGLVLPTLPYGQVWSLRNFPGSITLKNESLISILVDIGESLYKQGFTTFAMINGHLGNGTALKEAARVLFETCPELRVFYFFYPGMNQAAEDVRETKSAHNTYFHACEIETSYMLYLAPDFVDMDKAITDIPEIPANADVTPTPWETFTKSAVLGDAKLATSEKGKYIIDIAIENMVRLLTEKASS